MKLFGAPLSTSTSPSLVEKATTFAPPPSSTAILSVRGLCAKIRREAHRPSAPPRSSSKDLDDSCYTPAIVPVLSPNLSRSNPTFCNSVKWRFAIGVRSGSNRCWPTSFILPAPPPTTMFGSG